MFFHKKSAFDLTVPDRYASLLSQREFEKIAHAVLDYLGGIGQVLTFENGLVTVKDSLGQNLIFALDNLVRKCHADGNKHLADIVAEHFTAAMNVQNNMQANLLLMNFNLAHDKLVLRLYPESFMSGGREEKVVGRCDLPGTFTALCLDALEGYQLLFKDSIAHWGITHDTLMEIAAENVAKSELQVQEFAIGTHKLYQFAGEHAAVAILQAAEIHAETVGLYGAVVSIPTSYSAFIHPLDSEELPESVAALRDLTRQIFSEEPSHISGSCYLLKDGNYEILGEFET